MRFTLVLTLLAISFPALAKDRAVSAFGAIPPSAAVVREVWTPHVGRPDFIVIEDVHAQPEIQGTIASLIVHAHSYWNSRRVLVEGAFGEVGSEPFPRFSVARGDRRASELLREGRLSGAELAAALVHARNPDVSSALQLSGMDDRALYVESLSVYQKLSDLQSGAIKTLAHNPRISRAEKAWLARLLLLRLTPEQYQRTRRMHWSTEAERVTKESRRLAMRFYQLANLRSHRFEKRALSSPRSQSPCLVVTGGFHTPALTQAFRRAGRSYWVVTPRQQRPSGANFYDERLRESALALVPEVEGPAARPMAVLRLRRS